MKKIFLLLSFVSMIQVAMSCSDDDEDEIPSFYVLKVDRDSISQTDTTDGAGEINDIWVSLYADNGRIHQSAASYGDYALFVTDRRSSLYLYNLKNKKFLCKKDFGAVNERTTGNYILYHCNQMTFGVDFYEESDAFPLLYISQRARSDERCFVEVYRLIPSGKSMETDYTSLDAELVQTIFFPVQNTSNDLGRVNSVIDASSNLMYTYSYNTITSGSKRHCRISCFSIPDIYQKEVVLNDEDIMDSFILNYYATNSQGGCIKDHILYISQGFQSIGYIYLNVIDLRAKKLIDRINLLHNGIYWEPEGCFAYEGNIMLSTGTNIWKFVFY